MKFLAVSILSSLALSAGALDVANADFSAGADKKPNNWTGSGAVYWVPQVLGIMTGGVWQGDKVEFKPNSIYQLSVATRYWPPADKTKTAYLFIGTDFFMDGTLLRDLGPEAWTNTSTVFMTPSAGAASGIRFSEYLLEGKIELVKLQCKEAVREDKKFDDGIVLGVGESIKGNQYRHDSAYDGALQNISRPLQSFTGVVFHDTRWRFTPAKGEIIYSYAIEGRKQQKATVSVNAWASNTAMEAIIAASNDGTNYTDLVKIEPGKTVTVELPKNLFPADKIFVKLYNKPSDNQADPNVIQIPHYGYSAEISGAPAECVGSSNIVAK